MAKKEVILKKLSYSIFIEIMLVIIFIGVLFLSWYLSTIFPPFQFGMALIFIILIMIVLCVESKGIAIFNCPYCKKELEARSFQDAIDCSRCKERILIKWK